jgi:hypothetical protein
MFKTIAQPAPELASFIEALNLPLSRPQQRHVTQIADSLVTIEGNKTLSAMYRHIVGAPCSKSAADTFREAPWRADDLRISLREFLVQAAFTSAEAEAAPKRVFLSLDDSLTDKDNGSRRLQAVDWHYNHTHALPQRPAGSQERREADLPHQNPDRPPDAGNGCAAHPAGYQVYLLCESWYAAASLIKWCRAQDWHVICRLWRVESVEKYMMVLWLALTILEYRQASAPEHKNPADVIRAHRQEHAVRVLKEVCSMVLQFGSVPAVLARFTFAPAPS